MKKSINLLWILVISVGVSVHGQSREQAFETLGALVGGTWTYEGQWENGEFFKQEIKYRWGLDQKIIKVQTYGVIDKETKTYGLRSEGIRTWDKSVAKIKFYEFDTFGGITEGYCIFEHARFHYEYHYELEGKLELFRDTWKRINKDTYQFSVNMRFGKEWKTYTANEYRRIK